MKDKRLFILTMSPLEVKALYLAVKVFQRESERGEPLGDKELISAFDSLKKKLNRIDVDAVIHQTHDGLPKETQ